jgi:3-oxoadipate enol-lactonase
MKDGFIKTTHGRIHYLEAGSGRPIILLQSNGNSAYQYDSVMALLAKKYHVIAWDQPGQGDSDRITRHYSVEDYGDAAIAFIDALGLDKANVLGSSIGGAIAIDLGDRYAKRIDRLWVMESPIKSEPEWAAQWLATEEAWSQVNQTWDQVSARMHDLTKSVFQRWNIDRSKAGVWCMLDVMWALRLYDAHAAVKRISTKHTMGVFGNNSPHSKVAGPLLQRTVPGLKLEVMKNCGHFPMIDDAEGLARIMDDFIND